MKKPKIMYKTHIYRERGLQPSRLVLLRHYHLDGTVKEYSTHMQVMDEEQGAWIYGGTYHRTLRGAKEAFNERIKRYPEFMHEGIR